MSSWGSALFGLAIGLAVIGGLFILPFLGPLQQDFLARCRASNLALVCDRFGMPLAEAFQQEARPQRWHRRLQAREEMLGAGSVAHGLREILLIEDHAGDHWRVRVSTLVGSPSEIDAQKLGEAPQPANGRYSQSV